jgi:hypothetical protein
MDKLKEDDEKGFVKKILESLPPIWSMKKNIDL